MTPESTHPRLMLASPEVLRFVPGREEMLLGYHYDGGQLKVTQVEAITNRNPACACLYMLLTSPEPGGNQSVWRLNEEGLWFKPNPGKREQTSLDFLWLCHRLRFSTLICFTLDPSDIRSA